MKKILFLFAALGMMALALNGCNSGQKPDQDADENTGAVAAEWVEVTLNVEGMTCEGCENAVKAGVENLEGIASVESSHEEAWTKVKYDAGTTSVEEITAKITETGYLVKGEI